MLLSLDQLDRACGAVLASAAGDALGAAYEFGCATVGPNGPQMLGGGLGNFAPGEWTDDTSMAVGILRVAAARHELTSDAALTDIARQWSTWYDGNPPDIGIQTRTIFSRTGSQPTATELRDTAYALHGETGRTAGNGSLMRTAAVALPHLDDADTVAAAARAISDLTHTDARAGEACVLWSLAIRHAILEAELDLRAGLPWLEDDARAWWLARIEEAEASGPGRYTQNAWVVEAFQAAWSAIVHTPTPPGGMPTAHLRGSLATAIAIGHDTDTVAAIAGALLGARWGASAVPNEWRRMLHGWPGLDAEDLVELATRATLGGLDR